MSGLIYCPHCRGPLQDDGTLAGQSLICPRCRGQFDVPGPPPRQQFVAEPSHSSAYSAAIARRFKESNSLLDILVDFRFEKYITPIIVRATWIVALISIFAFLLLMLGVLVMSILPPEGAQPPAHPNQWGAPNVPAKPAKSWGMDSSVISICLYAGLVVGAFLALLWLRVALEGVIVIFNIAESLVSIDQKTGARP